jgi:hypothetical protein
MMNDDRRHDNDVAQWQVGSSFGRAVRNGRAAPLHQEGSRIRGIIRGVQQLDALLSAMPTPLHVLLGLLFEEVQQRWCQ